jgi:pimeloyl-ACP methyl ester carboxylesterase
MPTIHKNDAEIRYETSGSGDPLVLVPGFASGAWSWKWQIEPLSENSQVITFDPRGISRSRLTGSGQLSIELIADDVAAILDSIGAKVANILGISFGGFVAQEFALKYPDRTGKLVLASSSFGGKNHVAPEMPVLVAFASTEGMNSAERIRQYLTMAFTPGFVESDPGTVDEFCRLRGDNAVPESVYLGQLRAAMGFESESRLRQIAAETLMISGDSDVIVPVQNSINLAAAIPNARIEIIAGGGHMAFVEQANEFNRVVGKFIGS